MTNLTRLAEIALRNVITNVSGPYAAGDDYDVGNYRGQLQIIELLAAPDPDLLAMAHAAVDAMRDRKRPAIAAAQNALVIEALNSRLAA